MSGIIASAFIGAMMFIATVVIPAVGKFYVELKHQEVMSQVEILRIDMHYFMEKMGVAPPPRKK